jgi:hypothetical protein
MSKKRAMITVDAEKWDRLQAKLKEDGYSPSAMSDYIGVCLDELERFLYEGDGSGFPPYLPLLVQRYGLGEALRKSGYCVVREREREERERELQEREQEESDFPDDKD